MVHCKTQTASSGQRRCLQEGGQSFVLTGQIHTGKGDKSGKEELFWQAKEQIIFQWLCFSVESYNLNYQLQDTIPQHCGESTTSRRAEWVLLQVWKNTIHTSCNPPLLHTCTADKWRRCAQGSSEWTKEGRHQAQMVWHQSVWNPVLTSLPQSSTDHWSCVKSPHASNAPSSSPSQRNPKLLDLMPTDLWL